MENTDNKKYKPIKRERKVTETSIYSALSNLNIELIKIVVNTDNKFNEIKSQIISTFNIILTMYQQMYEMDIPNEKLKMYNNLIFNLNRIENYIITFYHLNIISDKKQNNLIFDIESVKQKIINFKNSIQKNIN